MKPLRCENNGALFKRVTNIKLYTMPLIRKNESFPARPVVVLLVGTPFSYKTSMAITSKKPLLCDFELGSERAHGKVETYRFSGGWKEFEDDINVGLLDEFNTLIMDTVGSAIDGEIWNRGLEIKFTKNGQQNWGTVKDLFTKFVALVRGKGLDFVGIAHETFKDKDDERVYDIDISGSGKKIVLRQADQVGFVTKQDFREGNKTITKTVITFNPTKSLPFCKNVAQLDDIIVPDKHSADWDTFLDRCVIQPTKDRIAAMSDDQRKAIEVVATYREAIDEVTMSDADLKALNASWKDEPEHIRLQLRSYFGAHLKAKGWKYYADKTEFAPIVTVEPAPVVETPPVEAEKEPDLFEAKEGE